ncbi:MAG: tetraacyldisaccharide 4'-kinase [Lonepinella koalarum]|nr:tetraacyldisaccharide 4'-kinase [Lonepinella koalarum]
MDFWYRHSIQAYLLLPLSWLFALITAIRRGLFKYGILKSYRPPKPVVIVGNLSVGGNGKTPVVIWLVEKLAERGIKCGVISRGYGSKSETYPLLVTDKTDPIKGGDEPVLIAKRTQVPVCISANRQQAIEHLLSHINCDVIISDDGLQHYKLSRDIEIVVMDAERGLGNGLVLPAGPLRESEKRLTTVDFIIANGGENTYCHAIMNLIPSYAINLVTQERRPLSEFKQGSALAGIGNPQRFFNMLQGLGIELLDTYALQDHQAFTKELMTKFDQNQPHFMTEKDAVKCVAFAQDNFWYVPVEAHIEGHNAVALLDRIQQLTEK